MPDATYAHEEAPAELRVPALQRALRAVRPAGDAIAQRSRTAADVIGRRARTWSEYSLRQARERPLAAAGVALAAGALIGALLSPRRRRARTGAPARRA